MGKIILSHMILPRVEQADVRNLYIRGSGRVMDGRIQLEAAETVRFDTYFNGFFYTKYLSHTQVEALAAVIQVSGACRVELLVVDEGGREAVLAAQETTQGQEAVCFQDIVLSKLPAGGMLYLQVTALSNGCTVRGGRWEGEIQVQRQASLAIVICTYRRETYVRENIQLLCQTILRDMEDAELFVIDNGRTLGEEYSEKVHILPNRNYGGSGGFTRGLIEAHERGFTHVLFMDDDIRFEAEVLYRTIQLLKASKHSARPLMIGGAMLIEDQPTIQIESGAFYQDGRLRPVGRGLDVSKAEALLENDVERHVQYNAWWYCCFPTALADEIGLPLPFFIKSDDVEYGLRAKADVLLLNGIGVWHAAFSGKYSPHLEYYIKRNELIVSALHKEGDGGGKAVWKILRASGKALLKGEPSTVRFLLQGAKDFMEGPAFFERTDEEELNQALIALKAKPFIKPRLLALLAYPFLALPVLVSLLLRYRAIQRLYLEQADRITSLAFWKRHLGLS